jgi:hypothetical protein
MKQEPILKVIIDEHGQVQTRPMTPEEISALPPALELPDLPSVFDLGKP